jgi:hypothetical protein
VGGAAQRRRVCQPVPPPEVRSAGGTALLPLDFAARVSHGRGTHSGHIFHRIRSCKTKIQGEFTQRASSERLADRRLGEIALARLNSGCFGPSWNHHSTIYLKRQILSRVLYQDMLYRKILDVAGVVCEFGVHWGATMATLMNLRGIYEPYNHSRVIYGFDTFAGFPDVDKNDGDLLCSGDYATSDGYEAELAEVLAIHEAFSPISHLRKFDLIKGDVLETLPKWLEDNPHAIVAMAIFDMDIYMPTKAALKAILPRLTIGSLLVFDELNCKHFPGETQAVIEVLGLHNIRLQHFPHQPYCAFAVYEGQKAR